ncbi:MAG: hypothetical protein AB8F95_15530 [Bacteroidia bacterium]
MANTYRHFSDLWDNPRHFNVGKSFRDGWDMFSRDALPAVGFSIIASLIALMGGGILSFIPLIGPIFAQTLIGALLAGFYLAGYRLYRNESIGFSTYFRGFDHLGQIVIMNLIYAGVYFVLAIVLVLLGAIIGFSFFQDFSSSTSGASPGMIVFLVLIMVVFFTIIIAFSLAYMFAVPNVTNLKLQAWDAMELSRRVAFKQAGGLLGLFFLIVLINVLGTLLFGIGLLITVPVSMFVVQAAWEQVIGGEGGQHLDNLIDEFGTDKEEEIQPPFDGSF